MSQVSGACRNCRDIDSVVVVTVVVVVAAAFVADRTSAITVTSS